MTAEAVMLQTHKYIELVIPSGATYTAGEVIQLADGRAGVVQGTGQTYSAGQRVAVATEGIFTVAKTASMVFLSGGKLYWDHSANAAHFKKVNDRDFYLGAAYGDAASSDTTCKVNLNVQPVYTLDIAAQPFTTVLAGTLATAGPNIHPRGGAVRENITATNEAQKVDALSNDGVAAALAKGIVELAFTIIDGDAAGAADFNIGIASATHATDADSIAQHLFAHMDGNSTKINFQSKDGTTTVAAADSTKVYVAAARSEVWFDCRVPSAVVVYVDGVRVLSGTAFDVSAAASTWKLLAHLEKTSSTDTFDATIDWLRMRFGQQATG